MTTMEVYIGNIISSRTPSFLDTFQVTKQAKHALATFMNFVWNAVLPSVPRSKVVDPIAESPLPTVFIV